MDPRSNSTASSDFSQSGDDAGQLPPIHAAQSFRAPAAPPSHFDAATPPPPSVFAPPITDASQPAATAPPAGAVAVAPPSHATAAPASHIMGDDNAAQFTAAPAEDTDNAFDEEWVGKAKEVINRYQTDPFLLSQELGKLKAQYIKLRYNKDIKVEE